MKGKKKEHQWDHMGFDTETNAEYSYCDLCKKYRKEFHNVSAIISKSAYEERVKLGKVKIDGKVIR